MLKKYLQFIILFSLYLSADSIDCHLLRNTNQYLKECNFYDTTRFIKVPKNYKKIAPMSERNYEIFFKIENQNACLLEFETENHFVHEHFEKEESVKKEDLNQTKKPSFGHYTIKNGDMLSKIVEKFSLKTSELVTLNKITNPSKLKVGKKLKIPLAQEFIDVISSAKYKIKPNDTLLAIAYKFKLNFNTLLNFNDMERSTKLRIGKILNMPFPYILKDLKATKRIFLNIKGKKKLRVTATAYSSHCGQTDKTPFLAAWNNKLKVGMKIIAVSRDLLTRYGMKNGTKVWIGGLKGYYRVRDKMNKRYKKRIDIYMGLNRKKALKWGKKSVVIYWK